MDKIFGKKNVYLYNPTNRMKSLHCIDIGYRDTALGIGQRGDSMSMKSYLTILIVTNGEGMVSFNDVSFKVEKRDIVFVPTCVDFRNMPINNSQYKYLWLSLDGEDFIKYFEDKPNYKKHFLNNINFDKIAYIITKFLVEITQEILNELDMLCLVLKTLSYIETQVERKNEEEYVEKTISILASNFENPNFKIDSVAKELHLSHSWLCALFKKKQKTTMQQFLMNLRLSKASEMLINSHTSIKDISYLCGFNDSLYFSYIFKKNVGLSPLAFRKEKRKV